MGKWEAGIISKDARYRTQSETQSRGIYSLEDQLRHKNASNWLSPLVLWPDDAGQRIPATLIVDTAGHPDDTGAYSVYHNDFDAAAAEGTTGRLYISIKCTANTAYYNDFCIGGVQLTSDDYSTLEHGWSFNVVADYTGWQYATVTGLNTSDAGHEDYTDIVGAASQVWSACVNSTANARISRATSTGSTGTGAADGIASEYSDSSTGTIIGSATSTIAQTSSTSFMFTESSGTASNIINKWWWVRSEEVSLNGEGDKNIAVIYHAASPATVGMTDAADEPLIRWWWKPS